MTDKFSHKINRRKGSALDQEKVRVIIWLDHLNAEHDKKVVYAKQSKVPIIPFLAREYLHEDATIKEVTEVLQHRLNVLESR
ncbi:hypothetical protein C9I98_08760 [Photobacterium sanctipauli]|uniref:Uncharacterized protein n=1 Tax=Photobacterium sanctipauli TaxID=1342794 RepID=A0A2T3NV94_9GAMM|nr:hypothetical protein [Photobacterium sanctipauli]PSW20139.1 hypothetical protein C9I98_08760 [Photobacterium sanctipauli]